MTEPVTIARVAALNYKSVAECDVRLGPLAVIVGRNGAGKSNFLDVLRFSADALHLSLDRALRERGGFGEVCRRAAVPAEHFGIRLDFLLGEARGWYAFTIGGRADGSYVVGREECRVSSEGREAEAFFQVENGRCVATSLTYPPVTDGALLYLVRAASAPEFRPVYRALCDMGFYHIDPRRMGGFHAPTGERMLEDGSNAAGVLATLKSRSPATLERVTEYLGAVVPEIADVDSAVFGNRRALVFHCRVNGAARPVRYFADSMSDGTLHALGILLALFQSSGGAGGVRVVGIEEPETALHPDAAGVLTDVLLDASQRVQVIVTTHSADLLDRESVPVDAILPVVAADGESKIGPLDEVGRSVLREGTFTAGELLRIDQLHPDPHLADPQSVDLFRRA